MPMYRLMSTRISRALVFLTLALLVTAMLVLFVTGNEARADLGIQDTPRITKLIYPTLGNPAIRERGGSLTIEYDPREGSSGSSIPEIIAFQVTVSSSNDKYPLSAELPVTSFEVKASEVWYWLKNANFEVYHVTVTVPYSLPEDLYDLTVKAKTGGSWVTDSQPHALQSLDEYKDHFSFCHLTTPAVESSFAPEPGSAQDVTCTITNHLEKPLLGAYAEFPMPALSNKYYYKVADGSFGHVYDTGNHRACQVNTDVAASSAKAPRVYKSASPDTKAPGGSFKINNGADTTTTREVTLNIVATDTGGSGLKDMLISNDPEFQGATWEKYDSTRKWTLAGGTAGRRHVYMKFRDMAMPANESSVAEDEIMYSPAEDEGGPAYTWYFAEGCTRAGFEEWLCIQNPNDSECDVDITYMTETGENIPQTVTVGPESRHTVDVNSVVGPERDVSMKVEGSLPIMVERPMYFDYQGMWKGGHDVIGTNNPRTRWYFAEGCTREGPSGDFHTWLCMQNPQDEEVQVTITYMLESGENHVREVSIPPLSRKTEGVNSDVGPGQDVSIMVEASNAIICERPMYFNYQGIQDGGHAVMGAVQPANEWYLAEGTTHGGFSTYVCMQNPNNTDAGVTLQYMLQDGNADDQELVIPARSRKTVLVNDWVGPANNVSIKVSSDNPIITERPMYFNYGSGWPGGHCVVGAPSPKGEWYFAEGCTRAGFEEWLSIQNPSDTDADVRISYMWEDGTNLNQGVDVPAGSRATVNVNDFMAGSEHDVSATIFSDVPVIVERPMYFNYHGEWPGGHCVVGSCTETE